MKVGNKEVICVPLPNGRVGLMVRVLTMTVVKEEIAAADARELAAALLSAANVSEGKA